MEEAKTVNQISLHLLDVKQTASGKFSLFLDCLEADIADTDCSLNLICSKISTFTVTAFNDN